MKFVIGEKIMTNMVCDKCDCRLEHNFKFCPVCGREIIWKNFTSCDDDGSCIPRNVIESMKEEE